MADNVTIGGNIIATDQIPGTLAHVQKVKLMLGFADSDSFLPTDPQYGMSAYISREMRTSNASVFPFSPTTTGDNFLPAVNNLRCKVLLENASNYRIYVRYGARLDPWNALVDPYSITLDPGDYWEMPTPIYLGLMSAIWPTPGVGDPALTGKLMVTEMTL